MADMQKDLVLSPNEYAYVLDETKGNVACNVGPHKMSLSQSDRLVIFDKLAKKFIPCRSYDEAKQIFTTAPEGWYIALKNPAPNNRHPSTGTSNTIPENMQIGCKVNIPGPASFALYPGQMATVIKGHSLRSNQYLVAMVYDANSLNPPATDGEDQPSTRYINGQTLIIKGTEVSFYIPPTGIEVKAIDNDPRKGYVRDAVTLERLEYCILKDEDGNKRYVHGPDVVFPKPTESFISDNNGNIKRNAIELSDISGVYVKVIADYKDATGEHKAGEELFITGKDQMIYYPRPEHTFITYNGRIMHHAIAIPKGEGRYIMNRKTGEIKTVKGPAMYLPDPRDEVAVKRVLTRNQCELWYPGNREVLEANGYTNLATKDALNSIDTNSLVGTFADSTMYAAVADSYSGTPFKKETNKISRSNTFTPPRTISLGSSKYEGAVALDVWTGYAVNVISKDGDRRVVRGPQTVLLDYDQTLEVLELSTGKPKTTDNLEHTVYLRCENNRISDIINVETSDFVQASVKVSYHVNFDVTLMEKWFSIDNYVKHLCDWGRSAIKNEAKKYTIGEFHDHYHDIVLDAIHDADRTDEYAFLHEFSENGMVITDVEILALEIDAKIQKLMDQHQAVIVGKSLDLAAASASAETENKIIALNTEKTRLSEQYRQFQLESQAATENRQFELNVASRKAEDEERLRVKEVELELQKYKNLIFEAEQAREKEAHEAELAHKKAMMALDIEREAARAESIAEIVDAISPQLASAMQSGANKDILSALVSSIAPYAIAKDEDLADSVNKMVRGTTMEQVLSSFTKDA